MSVVQPTPRVKLRTATRRVPRTRNPEADASAGPDAEPNMELSRAVLVMLLLHLVAIGGILAFSLIKERGHAHAATNPASNAVEAEDSDAPPAKVEGNDTDHAAAESGGTLAATHPAHPGDAITRITNDPSASGAPPNGANDAAARIAGGRASAASTPTASPAHLPPDSGKTYVVQKGDSPYPRKLKPGQTLHVPAANHAKSK